jgi:hypothetical protein
VIDFIALGRIIYMQVVIDIINDFGDTQLAQEREVQHTQE